MIGSECIGVMRSRIERMQRIFERSVHFVRHIVVSKKRAIDAYSRIGQTSSLSTRMCVEKLRNVYNTNKTT